jgi:hypothetical protein
MEVQARGERMDTEAVVEEELISRPLILIGGFELAPVVVAEAPGDAVVTAAGED